MTFSYELKFLVSELIIIDFLYLQLTNHINVPWTVPTVFMQVFLRSDHYCKDFSKAKKIKKDFPNTETSVGHCMECLLKAVHDFNIELFCLFWRHHFYFETSFLDGCFCGGKRTKIKSIWNKKWEWKYSVSFQDLRSCAMPKKCTYAMRK